jgi:hypothetical protein
MVVKNAPGLRPFIFCVGLRTKYAVAKKVVIEIVTGAKSCAEEQRLLQFGPLLGGKER